MNDPTPSGRLFASPDPDAALRNLSRYVHARGSRLQFYHLLSDDPAMLDRLIRVFGASRYLADVLVRNPEYIEVLSDSAALEAPRSRAELTEELDRTCGAFPMSLTGLDVVRRFRRRELLRIGAADLCGMTDLRQTTEQLSSLADAVVDQCLRIVASGDDSHRLIVLALGKLGGDELNYSSDIDLVFVTPTSGQLDAAARLARALTHALSDRRRISLSRRSAAAAVWWRWRAGRFGRDAWRVSNDQCAPRRATGNAQSACDRRRRRRW